MLKFFSEYLIPITCIAALLAICIFSAVVFHRVPTLW